MKIVVTGSPIVQIHVVKAPVRRIIRRMANFALASGYRLPYQENIVEHITFSEKKMVNKASKSKGLFIWYRNNFHSGMSFVPEWSSYYIHVIKSTGSALGVFRLPFFFSPDQISLRRSPPNYTIYHFQSVYMIPEWNVVPEREFYSEWKPEWVTVASCK